MCRALVRASGMGGMPNVNFINNFIHLLLTFHPSVETHCDGPDVVLIYLAMYSLSEFIELKAF